MSSQLRVDKILPVDGAPTGGGGGIIQVVTSSTQTGQSQAFSAGSTFVDTGLSASITPKFSTSKILVTGYLSFYIDSSANGSKVWNFAICDGSDNILDGTTASDQGYRVNGYTVMGENTQLTFYILLAHRVRLLIK